MNKEIQEAMEKTSNAFVRTYDPLNRAFPLLLSCEVSKGHMMLLGAPGLSKREWLAGMAMQGMCVMAIPGGHNSNSNEWNAERARHAVAMADAVLAELKRIEPNPSGICP